MVLDATCYMTQVNVSRLNPNQASNRFRLPEPTSPQQIEASGVMCYMRVNSAAEII